MNDEQVTKYIQKLIETQGAGLDTLEREVFDRLVKAQQEVDQHRQRLRAASKVVETSRVKIQQAIGSFDALADLLVAAEVERRNLNQPGEADS